MKRTFMAVWLCIITLPACIAHHPVSSVPMEIASDKYPGTIKEAKTGDVIFEEGSYDIVKALEMSSSIESTMPGGMGLPFGFSIRKTILKPHYQTDWHVYYAAPFVDVLSSHTLLGSVIVEGDTVGLRVDKQTGKQQWYVDNSVYNRKDGHGSMPTIWYRDVEDADKVTLKAVDVREYRSQTPFKQITFEGAYDNNLLFIYSELSSGMEKDREYRFDTKNLTQGITVSMKGNTLKVIAVTNEGIQYTWL